MTQVFGNAPPTDDDASSAKAGLHGRLRSLPVRLLSTAYGHLRSDAETTGLGPVH